MLLILFAFSSLLQPLLLLSSVPSPSFHLKKKKKKAGQWSNLHAFQWELSYSRQCNQSSTGPPPCLTLPISSLSNGLQSELLGDLRGPSPTPPTLFFTPFSFLSQRPIKKQGQRWQGLPTGASDWTSPGLLPARGESRRLVRLFWSPATSTLAQ